MQKDADIISTDGLPFRATEVLDIDKLTPLFHSYTSITNIAAALIDLEGAILIASNWKDSCAQFHRQNETTLKRCLESDTALANDIQQGGDYNVYYCKNGLIDAATPVVIGGYHVANVFIGQFFSSKPDLEYFRKQALDVGFDESAYLDAIARVPIFTDAEVKHNMEFIVQLAEIIGEMGVQNLHIRQANDELKKAKEKAEVANEAKSVFLSRMSHELRTPLNAVLGFAQLVKLDVADSNEDVQLQLDHIINAGDHLLSLISDIMDVVSLDNRGLKIPLVDVPLAPVVADCLAMVESLAVENNITLIVSDVDFCVRSNAIRLKQVLINLLTNAIKYNQRGGTATVKAQELSMNRLKISVIDTGVGIHPDEINQLFQPFSRLPHAEKSAIQGSGIGLSLCKYLVEEMQGTIAIDHSAADTGSVFSVTLVKGFGENIAITEPNSVVNSNRLHLISEREDMTGSILYIEDNGPNRKLLELVATKYPSLIFESASDAEQGLQLAERMNPTLIILDINLPAMSGIEVVKSLRANTKFKNTRIVALSADALPSQIDKAMQAGFDDYITKPIGFPTIAELFESIRV